MSNRDSYIFTKSNLYLKQMDSRGIKGWLFVLLISRLKLK